MPEDGVEPLTPDSQGSDSGTATEERTSGELEAFEPDDFWDTGVELLVGEVHHLSQGGAGVREPLEQCRQADALGVVAHVMAVCFPVPGDRAPSDERADPVIVIGEVLRAGRDASVAELLAAGARL